MMFLKVFFIFLLVHQLSSAEAMNVEDIKRCCNLGTNHSLNGKSCQSFPTPVEGINENDASQCLRSVEVCCKRKERSIQCESGEASALSGDSCNSFDVIKKSCCEACVLGKESYPLNPTCDDYLSLGPSFTKCCQSADKTTTSSTSTVASTTSKNTPPSSSKSSDFLPPMENLCEVEGICAQICIPMGESYKCECNRGFTLMDDKISCKPDKKNKKLMNRCDLNNPCEQECVDTGVAVKCSCREGYELDVDKTSCRDIDECALGTHDCTEEYVCMNGDGTYYCEDPAYTEDPIDFDKKCPAGFKFNGEKSTCDDINECEISLLCPPPRRCENTQGSYICHSVKIDCPPGFYFKNATESCTDIDECVTGQNSCNKESQICINTKGNYTCVERVAKKTCPPGFKNNPYTQKCDDIDECVGDAAVCSPTEQCVNEEGSYNCIPKVTPFTSPPVDRTTATVRKPTTTKPFSCSRGFTLSPDKRSCIDINECQLGTHNCAETQRCDNSPGSYHCVRTAGCGTGYTYNDANEICEDDDECALGTHNCGGLGSGFKCRNTFGSYRCDPVRRTRPVITTTPRPRYGNIGNNITTEAAIISGERKKCLPGYKMNSKGDCEDINECESNPCGRGESCLNLHGRYQCSTKIQCRAGYDLNDAVDDCEDVNECVRGTHKCNPTQICRNGEGYYTCECPPGHHLNPQSNQCEDINECVFYRVCNRNSKCINTIGSYKCECKEGSKDNGEGCEDIDECVTIPNLCEHKCVNTPGSYRCACRSGFTLNPDNRTCSDVNECERFRDIKLCIGPCENIPGSYRCTCPEGYRIGRDGRTCQDIDECSISRNTCPNPGDICVNTRGSYKCFSVNCPPNYIRDRVHISRCKRPQNLCDPRDHECLIKPEQYTYHFIALVSDLPLMNNQLNLFTIQGPKFPRTRAEFNYRIVNVDCPFNVQRINSNYFRKDLTGYNAMKLYLTKSITGPQQAELEVEMKLFDDNQLHMSAVSRIFIIVSEFPY